MKYIVILDSETINCQPIISDIGSIELFTTYEDAKEMAEKFIEWKHCTHYGIYQEVKTN